MGCAALRSVLPPRAREEAAGDASPGPAERPRKGRRGKGHPARPDDGDGAVPEDHAGGAGGRRAGILRWWSAAPDPADDASAPRPGVRNDTVFYPRRAPIRCLRRDYKPDNE